MLHFRKKGEKDCTVILLHLFKLDLQTEEGQIKI